MSIDAPAPSEGPPGQRQPAIAWLVVVVPGLALVLVATWVTLAGISTLPAAFWVIAAQAVFFEYRPILATRQQPEGVLLSTAFLFAILFLWGIWPTVLVMAVANLLAQAHARTSTRQALFTVSMLALGFGSAYGTMALLGVRPSMSHPLHPLAVLDLTWMFAAWATHFLVVHLLVNDGGLLLYGSKHWAHVRKGFADAFWFYVISDLVVVCLSPLVVVLAQTAAPPLLLLISAPFAAVWKGAAFSRSQEDEALHDQLTGLPNRRLFLERCAESLGSVQADQRCALLLIDLDGFKEVNDSLGHLAGDRLLHEVGHRVRQVVGSTHVAGRLGGDEFAVFLPQITDPADGVEMAQRLRQALVVPLDLDGELLQIDGSVGVSLHPEHGDDVTELLRCADIAMYVAKRAGTGVSVYAPGDGPAAPGHGRVGRRISDAGVGADDLNV